MAVIINTNDRENTTNTENNILKLGPNKSIKLSPWKAKAKKEFIKLFKKKGEKVSEREILDVLVFPYISEPDKFYSSAELQYILIKLREISIKDHTLNFFLTCEDCKEEFEVSTTLDEMIHYKETQLPIQKNDIYWDEIESIQELENNLKKYSEEPPSLINMILNIKKYHGKEINSIEDFIEIYDDLDMDRAEEIESDWKNIISKFSIYQQFGCPHCGASYNYEFDIIPGFFDPLLPKE